MTVKFEFESTFRLITSNAAFKNLYNYAQNQDDAVAILYLTSEISKFNGTCNRALVQKSYNFYGTNYWYKSGTWKIEFETEEDYAHFCLVWS